jgi:hypothetical protein
MERRYLRDLCDLYEKRTASHKERERPILVADIGSKQPLTILETLLAQWPMHDLRYNNRELCGYDSTDSQLTKDLARGMETKILQKNFETNIIEIAVEFQNNLAAFERYNLVVDQHNEQWHRAGCPDKVFDPIHGETRRIKDQHVDEAVITSSRYPQPKSVYSKAEGPLAKARPKMERAPYVLVRYQIKVQRDGFCLGYAAYDSMDRVLYYNKVSHQNLAYLVRRSIQELWGNPNVAGKRGDFLEGIPMLIQGKKLSICLNENTRPEVMGGETLLKTSNPELLLSNIKQRFFKVLEKISRVFAPIGLILFTLWFCGHNLIAAFGDNPRDVKVEFMVGMLLILGAFYVIRTLAQYADRQVSALEAAKKLM